MSKLVFNTTLFSKMVLAFCLSIGIANADLLPNPENVRIEENTLLWDAVDDATGYNIYLNGHYFDTVKNAEQYSLTTAGKYWVAAFDDMGNYGSQYGYSNGVNIRPEYAGNDNTDLTSSVSGETVIVQKTCRDVGPGESCIANCPSSVEQYGRNRYVGYMSGGACSTSDIVEADAFVSHRSYKCTVPTFSGEVVAQAICVLR